MAFKFTKAKTPIATSAPEPKQLSLPRPKPPTPAPVSGTRALVSQAAAKLQRQRPAPPPPPKPKRRPAPLPPPDPEPQPEAIPESFPEPEVLPADDPTPAQEPVSSPAPVPDGELGALGQMVDAPALPTPPPPPEPSALPAVIPSGGTGSGGGTAVQPFSLPVAEPYDVRLLAPHLRLLNTGPTVALAEMLTNPANEGTPFASLCEQAGVDVIAVADLMEQLGVGMAKIQSSTLVAPVLQDVALDSRSLVTVCEKCGGSGRVDPLKVGIPSTLPEIECPPCGGLGKVRKVGDKHSRLMLFKAFGLVGGGGIQINNTNQLGVQVAVEGRQAKIVTAAQNLLKSGRDARLASEDDAIDPDNLVTYRDVDDGGGDDAGSES